MENFRIDRSIKVQDLFNEFFCVADFQREYVWEEENVSQLITDFADSYQRDLDQKRQTNYFIGAIVLIEDGQDLIIIDGQQRITTLFLIISALRNYFLKKEDKEMAEFLGRLVAYKRRQHGKLESKLRIIFNDDRADTLIKEIVENPDNVASFDDSTDTLSNLKNAFICVQNYLYSLEMPVDKFMDYILSNVVVLPYIAYSMKQALMVFETLNSKGKSLTPIDLVKSALFANEDESLWEDLKSEWNNFKETLERLNESDKRFLKYYILVAYGKKVPEDEVFDWIKNPLNTELTKTPFGFLKRVQNFAEAYKNILSNKAADGSDNKKIVNIRRLSEKGKQFFPLLISLRTVSPTSDNQERILAAIEAVLVSYSVQRSYTGAIEKTFSEWTQSLIKCKSDDEVSALIDNVIMPEVRRVGELAYNKLISLKYSDISKKKLLYVLLRIEAFLKETTGSSYKAITEFSNYEIEHIIPRNFDSDKITFMTKEEHIKYVDRLGNLVLIEKPLNRSIKDAPIEKKKEGYASSSFMQCKGLVTTLPGNNALAKAYNKVSKINTLCIEEIEERQFNIANLAAETFLWK